MHYATDNKLLLAGCKFSARILHAEVDFPLLGADFLRRQHLQVDIRNKSIVDTQHWSRHPCSSAQPSTSLHLRVITNGENPFYSMLTEFPKLIHPTFNVTSPGHGMEHHNVASGPPVWSRLHRLSPEKLRAAHKQLKVMADMGIIRPSSCPWSSPLHMVPKSSGESHPVATPDCYPIPHIQYFTSSVAGATIFSEVDLIRGYHKIPVAPADIGKTANATPFCLFEFLRMPFRGSNSGQTFQRMMDAVLRDLDGVFVYLDDVLVASRNHDEHARHLCALFSRLLENGLLSGQRNASSDRRRSHSSDT